MTSAKVFGNEPMKMLEPLSSAGAGHATSQTARAGPAVNHPTPESPGGLPYEIGCPAFTRELRQSQWPTHHTFKPDVGEKYNDKTHLSEFLSIYTIACKLPEPATIRCLRITFHWLLNPTPCRG